jgi:hypothetical protein
LKLSRTIPLAGGLIGALAIAVVATVPTAYAEPTLNGSAFAVAVDVKTGDDALVSVPRLPSATYHPGGDESVVKLAGEAVVDKSHGIVSAKVLNAASTAEDGTLTSRSSAAELRIELPSPTTKVVRALSLTAELVTASCATGPDGTTAESELADIRLATLAGLRKTIVGANGAVKLKAPKPNTTIGVPGVAKVVLNEQIKSPHGVTVNAVHVYLLPALKLLYGDLIIGQATCYQGATDQPTASPSESSGSPEPSASASSGETPQPGESETPGGGGGGLPVTGFKLTTFVGIGAGLIVAGGGLLWLLRRRKSEPETTDSA